MMKKIIAGLLFLAFSALSFAQDIISAQTRTREELLGKSKTQKAMGYIILIGGAVAVVSGSILFINNFDVITGKDNSEENGGMALVIAGGVSMVGSLFLFSASANNKREANALTVGLKMEKGMPDIVMKMQPACYPAISLKFAIR
jgi:hypothetical protein